MTTKSGFLSRPIRRRPPIRCPRRVLNRHELARAVLSSNEPPFRPYRTDRILAAHASDRAGAGWTVVDIPSPVHPRSDVAEYPCPGRARMVAYVLLRLGSMSYSRRLLSSTPRQSPAIASCAKLIASRLLEG